MNPGKGTPQDPRHGYIASIPLNWLKHQRNWLGAYLRDAAICFQGGAGTRSETAFAMGLGRPVVLVGEDWRSEFPIITSTGAKQAFMKIVADRVSSDGGRDIDEKIKLALSQVPNRPGYRHRAIPASRKAAGELVDLARSTIVERRDPPLPDIDGFPARNPGLSKWLAGA